MRRLFLAGFMLLSMLVYAQQGNYYITHYSPNLKDIDNDNFALLQDKDGLICIANRNGLLKFDGSIWRLIKTPGSVFSMCLGKEKEIFIGGNYGFGVIKKDSEGKETYKDLYNSGTDPVEIFKIEKIDDKLYLLSSQQIFEYNISKEKITSKWSAEGDNRFSNIFQHKQQLFIDSEDSILLEIVDKDLLKQTALTLPNQRNVVFSIQVPSLDNASLMGLSDNRLYLFNGKSFEHFKTTNDKYLANNNIKDVTLVSNEMLAVSTLTGGCLLIDVQSGEVLEIIGDYSGLPDDEVIAITSDKAGGLWVAHEFGLSRVASKTPLNSYSHFPGLEGNIMDIKPFDEHLYVATSLGLLYLDKVKNVDEIRYRLQNMVTANCDPNPEKKGFLNRLLNKVINKKNPQKEVQKSLKNKGKKFLNSIKSNLKVKGEANKYYYTYSEEQLEGVKYLYKPVKGMSVKCNQLLSTETSLLAASYTGLYEIKNHKANQIYNNGIRYIHKSKQGTRIYATTLNGEVIVLDLNKKGKWITKKDLFDGFSEPVNHVLEYEDNIWFCGNSNIFKASFQNGEIEKLAINNKYNDNIKPVGTGDKVYFLTSTDIFTYNSEENKITKDESLSKKYGVIEKSIRLASNSLLFYNGEKWYSLGHDMNNDIMISQLGIFKDVEEVFYDEVKNHLWVATVKNDICKIDVLKQDELKSNHQFSLQRIENASGIQLSTNNLRIGQQESEVKFFYSMPDFIGQSKVEYQYKLDGKADSKWSAWSKENTAYFNFLPKGNYTLLVKSRNSIGEESIHEVCKFKVLPPYWETVWFYIIEVLFFSGLVIFSYLLSHASSENQYLEKISRVLTFFTLILVIQLMDSIAKSVFNINSQTPVSEFFIEASIAIALFPMEKHLEKFMKNQNIKNYISKALNINFEVLAPKINRKIELLVNKINEIIDPLTSKVQQIINSSKVKK